MQGHGGTGLGNSGASEEGLWARDVGRSKGIECGEQAECKALPDGPGRHSRSTIDPSPDAGWDWGGADRGAVSRGQGSPRPPLGSALRVFLDLGPGDTAGSPLGR